MQHHQPIRRAVATAAAVAVAAATAGLAAGSAAAQPATNAQRAAIAAGWLARSLEGEHHNHYVEVFQGKSYPDYGDTADGVLGMDAAHVAQHSAAKATHWLAGHIAGYTENTCGSGKPTYFPGSLGKAMVVAEAQQESVRRFGGANLVKELEAEEVPHGQPNAGLFKDPNHVRKCSGFESPITQAFALIGLAHNGRRSDRPDAAAVSWLVRQQCSDGGWEGAIRSTPSQACTKSAEDVDATGFAVQALEAVQARHSAGRGVHWLKSHQKHDGAFGEPPVGPNTNSTAVAVQGLLAGNALGAARRGQDWILRHQKGCSAPKGIRGSLTYQNHQRETRTTRIAATTQGTQALAGGVLGEISRTGSTSDAPTMTC